MPMLLGKQHLTISTGQTHWPENNNYTNFDRETQSFKTNPIDKNTHGIGLWLLWTTSGFRVSPTLLIIYSFSKLETLFNNTYSKPQYKSHRDNHTLYVVPQGDNHNINSNRMPMFLKKNI